MLTEHALLNAEEHKVGVNNGAVRGLVCSHESDLDCGAGVLLPPPPTVGFSIPHFPHRRTRPPVLSGASIQPVSGFLPELLEQNS